MNLKLILPIILSTSLLAGCGSAPKVQGPYAVQLSHQPNQVKRVAISSFYVQFVTTQGREINRRDWNMTVSAMLKGLSQSDMQQISDGLYDQLVTELEKEGIEVVGKKELSLVSAYNGLKSDNKQSPYLDDAAVSFKGSTMVSAYGSPIYFALTQDVNVNNEKDTGQWTWISPTSYETFGVSSIVRNNMEISKQLNAATVSVRVLVPFVSELDIRKGTGWVIESAWKETPNAVITELDGGFVAPSFTFKATPGARIAEGGTRISITNTTPGSGDVGDFTLNKPIALQNVGLSVTKGNGNKGGGLLGGLARAVGADSETADFFVELDAASLKQAMKTAGGELFRDVALAIKNPPK